MTKRVAYISTSGRIAPRTCPACHTSMDAATAASLDRPRHPIPAPGDLLICAYCSALLVEQPAPFGFRLASQGEFDRLDPALQMLVRVWER